MHLVERKTPSGGTDGVARESFNGDDGEVLCR